MSKNSVAKILDRLDEGVLWINVINMWGGKSYEEVLQDLKSMYPWEDNSELASMIVQELKDSEQKFVSNSEQLLEIFKKFEEEDKQEGV